MASRPVGRDHVPVCIYSFLGEEDHIGDGRDEAVTRLVWQLIVWLRCFIPQGLRSLRVVCF